MAGASRAGPSVGIDLGTANLLVGVWQNDNVTILENGSGGRLLPAYVAFTDSGRLMGDAAKQQVTRNAPNTVFGIMHLIGRRFSDPKVQENMKRWPFKVVCDAENKPKAVVQFKGERRALYPVEILVIMLLEIREAATAFIGKDVRNAVLTVPAYFNYSQRQVIKDAGEVAGLDVMRLISGPTAASIAYGLDRTVKMGQRIVLVFDLGAGKLDVSLVAIEEDIFEVLATAGDINLGGDDFDNRLVEHCATEFRRLHHRDLHSNWRAMTRLAMACERSKRVLSASKEDLIQLDALYDGIDFRVKITTSLFEELCADLLDEVLLPVQQVLSAANVLRSKVDDVVLVGGSTRLPKVEQLLSSFFNGKTLAKCPRCEEVAVHGATVLAAMLTEELCTVRSLGEFMVLDVMPLPLGVEIDGRSPVVMIPRNTTIPTKKTRTFPRPADSQSVVRIQLFEGESDNIGSHHLGKLHVLDLPHKSCGESEIEVTFDIDPNAVLRVWVVDKSSGRKKQLAVDGGRLAPSEIERMSNSVGRKTVDTVQDEAKAALEEYANSVRHGAARRIAELKRSLEDAEAAKHKAAETLRWLGSNHSTTKQEFEVKRRKLEEAATPVTRNPKR